MHTGVVDRHVRRVENPPQQLLVRHRGIGLAKRAQGRLDGELARDLAVTVATDAVGEGGDEAARQQFVGDLVLPEAEGVFVDRARPSRGQLRVRQFHRGSKEYTGGAVARTNVAAGTWMMATSRPRSPEQESVEWLFYAFTVRCRTVARPVALDLVVK